MPDKKLLLLGTILGTCTAYSVLCSRYGAIVVCIVFQEHISSGSPKVSLKD